MPLFVFALEADGIRVGDLDDEIPLYCALFRFHRESTQSQVIMETRSLIQRSPAIDLHALGRECLEGMPAQKIRKTDKLQRLHDNICADQMQRGAIPSNPDAIGEGFRPYVVDRGARRLATGTRYKSQFVTLFRKNEKLNTLLACDNIKLLGR